MQPPDLNILVAFDALVATSSVTAAGARLGLSPSATSRVLGRVREAVGDPVLVRAGRTLVPTRRALALAPQIRALLDHARALLVSDEAALASREHVFTVRASDAMGMIASELATKLRERAPASTLKLVPEGNEDVEALRDGRIDLDIGVLGATGPEIRTQKLFRDQFVAVVRRGHPLARGTMTAERLASFAHVGASRRGLVRGPLDVALAERGLTRRVTLVVGTFFAAAWSASASDLVALLPSTFARFVSSKLHLVSSAVPFQLPPLVVAQSWHPRTDADPAHVWLRGCVKECLLDFHERAAAPKRP